MKIALLFALVSLNAQAQSLKGRYFQRIDEPGKSVVLEYTAPVTLLVVWKSDCKGCVAPFKEVKALQDASKFRGLQIYGLYSDIWSSYLDRAKSQVPNSLPQLHDPAGRYLETMKGVRAGTWVAVRQGGEIMEDAATAGERRLLVEQIKRALARKVK